MATEAKLKAERRQDTGKGVARKLRQAGKLPAVLYGGHEESVSLVLNAHETGLLFQAISVENTLIQLDVEGEAAPVATLVREVQAHPFRPEILHVDFLRVEKGVELELTVPLSLQGTPAGVRDEGGVLEQVVYEVPVRCIPSAIPENLVVDVSGLAIGDSIHSDELDIPEGVTLQLDEIITIGAVHPPRLEEEDEVDDEAEEPMVIGDEAEEGEDESSPASEGGDAGDRD
ncbi:50S ribosomal protein L25 [soil metagenome]